MLGSWCIPLRTQPCPATPGEALKRDSDDSIARPNRSGAERNPTTLRRCYDIMLLLRLLLHRLFVRGGAWLHSGRHGGGLGVPRSANQAKDARRNRVQASEHSATQLGAASTALRAPILCRASARALLLLRLRGAGGGGGGRESLSVTPEKPQRPGLCLFTGTVPPMREDLSHWLEGASRLPPCYRGPPQCFRDTISESWRAERKLAAAMLRSPERTEKHRRNAEERSSSREETLPETLPGAAKMSSKALAAAAAAAGAAAGTSEPVRRRRRRRRRRICWERRRHCFATPPTTRRRRAAAAAAGRWRRDLAGNGEFQHPSPLPSRGGGEMAVAAAAGGQRASLEIDAAMLGPLIKPVAS
eukprot:gene11058-biopygen11535